MADRMYTGCWWPDLAATIRPSVIPEAEVASLAFEADGRTLAWSPAAGAVCYDVLRGEIAGLADDGARILLGSATCVEEDSPDPSAYDPETPSPGTVYYYVVKPNGIHGSYGVGSGGLTRVDAGRACRR
jgi:hypothetical protein